MTAAFALQVCGWLAGVPLEFLLVAALLRGEYLRFPFVFAYASALLVTTLVGIPANVNYVLHRSDLQISKHFAKIYWINEGILQALILALVISLISSISLGCSAWPKPSVKSSHRATPRRSRTRIGLRCCSIAR